MVFVQSQFGLGTWIHLWRIPYSEMEIKEQKCIRNWASLYVATSLPYRTPKLFSIDDSATYDNISPFLLWATVTAYWINLITSWTRSSLHINTNDMKLLRMIMLKAFLYEGKLFQNPNFFLLCLWHSRHGSLLYLSVITIVVTTLSN